MMEFHGELLRVLCPRAVPACFMVSLLTLAKMQKRFLCPIGAHTGGHGTLPVFIQRRFPFHRTVALGRHFWECLKGS